MGFALFAGTAAAATAPPAEFGTDWHDPLTAAPPVATPGGRSCTTQIVAAQFKDFTPYTSTYTPPRGCGDHWSKVVRKVAGRQYDRLGYLRIGGVEVLDTSTPEPSPDGIAWQVEKDVTRYASTLRGPQPVEMLIGNVVNDTYTGVIDVKVSLTFYPARGGDEGSAVPDRVLTLAGSHSEGTALVGDLTTPRNSERIVAEVYATGSGGGCEEFWYLAVPADVPYSCQAGGPYREVQLRVDGQLAGIAAPFPHVWTGGWSNPFLWYVIPGPHAFDVKPVEYDLTPYAGLLNDGKAHRVEVSVLGVPAGRSGWSVPTNVLVWQDAHRDNVTGALTAHQESAPVTSTAYRPGDERALDATGSHSLTVAGYVDTSHGRVATTVRRALSATSTHRWNADESTDALTARWTDDETVTADGRGPAVSTAVHRTYTMDGGTSVGAADRLRTVLAVGDRADTAVVRGGRSVTWSRLDDSYQGDASFTLNVPRDQRHATGTSSERYRLTGSGGCYDHRIATAQGALTEDRLRC
ncbi:peptide-N4-asparagine amidase A [Streptomyces sp. H10-C2]|nr:MULTISPECIES: peptide-N4-asparagine amidase [unclassified Streptomyces]MDJ0342978.1 peptide-N4-asparagine amidase A [Streptomyces sp. PH10-H1]MDJ0371461.1 peptide-N4-asparagine amidase A [Streptomyces sp. H10-C2]